MSKLIMIILMVAILIVNLFLVWQVIIHQEAFFSNPLAYGVKSYDIDLCSCGLQSGSQLYFNQTSVWIKTNSQTVKINMTLIQELVR